VTAPFLFLQISLCNVYRVVVNTGFYIFYYNYRLLILRVDVSVLTRGFKITISKINKNFCMPGDVHDALTHVNFGKIG